MNNVKQLEIDNAVTAAFTNYQEVHPTRGKNETSVSLEFIRDSITKSRTNNLANNTRAARVYRKKVVNDLAAELGLRFAIDRDLVVQIKKISREVKEIGLKQAVYSTITTEETLSNPKGGRLMAYRLVQDGAKFFTEFSVAVCRSDEAFDPLLGKEIALKKFQNEETCFEREFTPRPPVSAFVEF